ncbi:FAD-linked sulfhydryl oxidase ALR [Hesseltinella vesiculosa]|uniref:Sulfhydryl oxidase n=1 Tax=Hesseltinella vesiculosa TaxID=101127 RepID=A0A1X2GKR9_9FUNG|nr:FAD-linked sulfhydryl oxidase ALR [Hesseltinella vesiculosa]
MTNGKPCRVCTDFKSWSRLEKQKGKQESHHDKSTSSGESTTATATAAASAATAAASVTVANKDVSTSEEWRKNNCPADVETLGRATWTLLHTTAAYYPEKPAPSQRDSMKRFIESFAEHYPCWFCKNDFQQAMAQEPVQVESRERLSQWLCRRHNEVNVKLNKPEFDCTKVFERWLNGPPDGKCDG